MLAVLVAGMAIAAGTNEVVRLDDTITLDAFSQGKIKIGGRLIRTDILILPDGTVQQDWHTETRHVLKAADITTLLDVQCDVFIIGTGHQGLMKPAADLTKSLRDKGLEVLILKTDEAIKRLKTLRVQGRKVSACLHIGC